MNRRNEMIYYILKYDNKYNNKSELLCKNNNEICEIYYNIKEKQEEIEKENKIKHLEEISKMQDSMDWDDELYNMW